LKLGISTPRFIEIENEIKSMYGGKYKRQKKWAQNSFSLHKLVLKGVFTLGSGLYVYHPNSPNFVYCRTYKFHCHSDFVTRFCEDTLNPEENLSTESSMLLGLAGFISPQIAATFPFKRTKDENG
jgi:hypothetical protein